MKIFNHKQLLIILKPKYNYPIICKLIIQQLRQMRFKFKQKKLLNNLLNYKITYLKDNKYIIKNRFELFEKYYVGCNGLYEYLIESIEDNIIEDNTKYKHFEIWYDDNPYYRPWCDDNNNLIEFIMWFYAFCYDENRYMIDIKFKK